MYIFSTWEFGTLSFPDSVAGTSSIMPQKKNMLPLEVLREEAGRSIGALTGALSAVKGSICSIGLDNVREGLSDAWPAFARFAEALPLLQLVFETAKPDEEKLLARCSENFSTATDVADGLVREYGISFREAHHVVGRAVQMVVARREDASGLTVEMLNAAADEELDRQFDISEETLCGWTEPSLAVASRNVAGGPALETTRAMIAEMQERLSSDGETLLLRQTRLRQSAGNLSERISAYLG